MTRENFIPYGRQYIDENDIRSLVEVMRSDWLTTGPTVGVFEEKVAEYVGAKHAVAVSSGTAALHCAMHALGIGKGDEVVVPPITFAATANCVLYAGGTPVFADVIPGSLLIDPAEVEKKVSSRTRAVIAVDYAGHPCDYDRLREAADANGLALVSDSCHALGAEYKGKKCGSVADLSVFSFHPVKHITTGEGGMVTTDDPVLAGRMRQFRNHGISAGHREREKQGTWYYEMTDLGFNYRLTDFQCALGISQLAKLGSFLERRRAIAAVYDEAWAKVEGVEPLDVSPDVAHAYHLYVVRIRKDRCRRDRKQVFDAMRGAGIGVNVHYVPVHLHPYYRRRFSLGPGLCPAAEEAYGQILSLPLHPSMTDADVERVVRELRGCLPHE